VDSNLNGDSAGDRAIINPAGSATVGSGVTGYNAAGQKVAAGSAGIVAYVANNPNARYIQAGVGAFANGGRNTLPLGRINNVDMSLSKKLNFRERYGFEVGLQAFNVFNHSQFVGGYISDVNSFGTAALSRAFLTPSASNFGQYDQFFPNNARTAQLFARLRF
jgi:hypothetical protein